MTKRESDILDIIKGYKGNPIKFLFLRRETNYSPAELRQSLDKLIEAKKIKQETTESGIVYKVRK
jgi:hypothetical protein